MQDQVKQAEPTPSLKKLKIFTFVFTTAFCIWVLFYPRYDSMELIAGLLFFPVAAVLAFAKPEVFALDKLERATTGVNLIPYVMWVVGCVTLSLVLRIRFSNEVFFLPFFVPMVLLSSYIVWVLAYRLSWASVVVLGVFYTHSLIILSNELSPAETEVVISGPVVRKYISKKPKAYMLVMQYKKEKRHIQVGEGTYERTEKGDLICIKDRTGWIGLTSVWYVKCPS
ncbi:hypothetical protein [Rheinheimera tangshanensis]|uniref:Uncharacterized protein n=1 Tax=Rheinheimera tangshanensis TaxID=400153 RepID=A0A5C8LWM4_9GAMM|nr:hypothetical protein [Rheinheimera tangshanensis]TXK79460.1 hypothetical protein FU839_13990 [Rheinheimera tangshanensis]GGM50804.1 hypothetical protein GCM10010920_09030 [Rheinheimera tangshanensis]